MAEAQENELNETKEADFSDLQSLLEAADLSEFNLEQGYTEEKQEFEKFEKILKFHKKKFFGSERHLQILVPLHCS